MDKIKVILWWLRYFHCPNKCCICSKISH